MEKEKELTPEQKKAEFLKKGKEKIEVALKNFENDPTRKHWENIRNLVQMYRIETILSDKILTIIGETFDDLKRFFIHTNFDFLIIDWSKLKFKNLINMKEAFYKSSNLKADLSHWNTTQVKCVSKMFRKATNVNLTANWDMRNATDKNVDVFDCRFSKDWKNTQFKEMKVNHQTAETIYPNVLEYIEVQEPTESITPGVVIKKGFSFKTKSPKTILKVITANNVLCHIEGTDDCFESGKFVEINTPIDTEVFIHANKNIHHIEIQKNPIYELDVKGCPKLKSLKCYDTDIKELDLTGLRNLHTVFAYNTKLTKLTIDECFKLQRLSVRSSNIQVIDINNHKHLQQIYIQDNKLDKEAMLLFLKDLIKLNKKIHVVIISSDTNASGITDFESDPSLKKRFNEAKLKGVKFYKDDIYKYNLI